MGTKVLRSFTKLLTRFLRARGKDISKKASRLYDKTQKANEFDEVDAILQELGLDDWSEIVAEIDEGLKDVMLSTSGNVLAELGVSGDALVVTNEAAIEFAERRAAELVGMRYNKAGQLVVSPNSEWAITDGTRNRLRELITEAFEEGYSSKELADSIEEDYAFSAARARTIGRTEVSRAHMQAAYNSADASGVVEGKKTLLGSDHDKEDECDEAADDGVIPLNEPFSNGQLISPFHPNCVCPTVFTVVEQ